MEPLDFLDHLAGPCDLSCLDFFSASAKVKHAWTRRGERAENYDIVSGGPEEDITTERGFAVLMLKGLRLLAFISLVVAGPPCSMFVWLSSSQRQRSLFGPEGTPRDYMTRLANRITMNAVSVMLWHLLSIFHLLYFCPGTSALKNTNLVAVPN